MAPRLALHQLLVDCLPENTGKVYFQPPENVKLEYPCIVYQRDSAEVKRADNSSYNRTLRYQVTVIDRNPDSGIPDKVAAIPMSSLQRFFVADQLNHDIYNIYF